MTQTTYASWPQLRSDWAMTSMCYRWCSRLAASMLAPHSEALLAALSLQFCFSSHCPCQLPP